jgi:di/tricarboxylate transporter
LEPNDTLFFSGNTQSIFNLLKEDNGLQIPKQEKIQEQFNFVEAVIPANSDLIGTRIKDSDFRKRYSASIVAIHRDGRRVAGKVGEIVLSGGDFLLLLAGENGEQRRNEKNLFFISVPKALVTKQSPWLKWLGLGAILTLILGITGVVNLFTICVLILLALVLPGVLKIKDITQNIDTALLMVLVCSLAIGVALEKSGTAALMATGILKMGAMLGPIGVISILSIATIFLTALITNAAAVSIVFPIALALASQTQLPTTPFFVAIAFAASGDFMTPIGYQTNLMVYGPGGYTFKDFFRVGAPLTLIYVAICVLFIAFYYNLI